MIRRSVLVCFSLLFSLVAVGSLRAQGCYVESTRSGSSGKAGTGEKMYYMPKMFKSVNGDGSDISILRFDKETLYHMDAQKKTYSSRTFAELKAIVDQTHSLADSMMARRLAEAPPDQQEKIRQTMEAMKRHFSGTGVTREAVPVDEHRTISGYACDKYIVKTNGKETETIWASKQVPGYKVIKRDMESFLDRMPGIPGAQASLGAWLKQIDGFPIQTESHGYTTTVKKIEIRTIPESEFTVPSGYTLVKSRVPGEAPGGVE